MEERKKMFYLYKSNLFGALFYIISSFYKKYLSISFYILKNLYICTQYTKAIRYT